jgi:RimJ/RimL family protein N-acetyltransferase
MQLIPFEEKDSSLLVSWLPNRESSLLWGGRVYDWPINPVQIVERQKKPEVMSFMMVDSHEKIGFIEILKVTNEECRLCRVIISNSIGKGNGYGKKLVKLAVSYIRDNLMAKEVTLAVFERNESALYCYKSVGFTLTSRDVNARVFDGCSWPLLQMKMVL